MSKWNKKTKLGQFTIDDLLQMAKDLNNKSFEQIGKEENITKGTRGLMVESFFGIKPNSRQEPDFKEDYGLDVELKTCPLRYIKSEKKYVAKERLVLSMINFQDKSIMTSFENSPLNKKIRNTLIVNYVEDENEPLKSVIKDSFLLDFSKDELNIISTDYECIVEKIKDGYAHLLTEKDTKYLAATTKGRDSNDVTKQMNSETLAKRRAFSLKTKFLNLKYNQKYNNLEGKFVEDAEMKIIEYFNRYMYKSTLELSDTFNLKTTNAKHKNRLIIDAIAKNNEQIFKIINESNIFYKVLKLSKNNKKVQESISFRALTFVSDEPKYFEELDIYEYINDGFLIHLFSSEGVYLGCKKITFNDEEISKASLAFDSMIDKLYLENI